MSESLSSAIRQTPSAARGVVPANRFLGTIEVGGLEAQVRALAATRYGDIVLLIMNGPRTTVSAIAATLHRGGTARKSARFTAAPDEAWDGPEQLYRMEGLGSGWITSAVEPTTHLDVAILAHGANITYCCQHPLPQPRQAEATPDIPALPSENGTRRRSFSRPDRVIPSFRFLLAHERAEHPDWMTFTGMMRTFWLPFPPSFAPLIWQAGLRTLLELPEAEREATGFEGMHTLIEPVEYRLGIAAWQVLPSPQWYRLLEQITRRATASGL